MTTSQSTGSSTASILAHTYQVRLSVAKKNPPQHQDIKTVSDAIAKAALTNTSKTDRIEARKNAVNTALQALWNQSTRR